MMILGAFLYALIDPVSLGGDRYANRNPLIGACASTKDSAQKIMQKLIDTQTIPLDAYNSVFVRSDVFDDIVISAARIYEGHTLFDYTPKKIGGTSPPRYRFILGFVWEKAKAYTREFIKDVERIISTAFSALHEAPRYFAKQAIPEKPRSVLMTELKELNPDSPRQRVNLSGLSPVKISTHQYINQKPLIGACATNDASAQKIMQKLVDTQTVVLEEARSVFGRADVFTGLMVHGAKVHDGYTIFNYSQVGDHQASWYRFILDFAWERAKSYTHAFLQQVQQTITTALAALKGAPAYFAQHPHRVPAVSRVGFVDQLGLDLERITQEQAKVATWTPDQIKSWKQRFTQKPASQRSIPEMLAVIGRASKLAHGYYPRDVQMLSVLSCLYPTEGQGHFLDVKTGEGKSLITAMLAISKVLLEDGTVDVLSSSEVLAERDAAVQKKFYALFEISVGFRDKSSDAVPEFYQNHRVLYSDILQFSGDILRQTYQGKTTRGTRSFDTLIIDEVDSLLVDQASLICKLETALACSESLLPFLQLLWLQLGELEKATLPEGPGESTVLPADQIEKMDQILYEFCEDLLEGRHPTFQLVLPPFLREFVHRQIPVWIRSARQASVMQVDKDYIYLKNDRPGEPGTIKIVDAEHTGVVQEHMVWESGLHQFLLLKHDGCIFPENLTSCFLSVGAYLAHYKKNIFGLTGTLGDTVTRTFLRATYGVNLFNIPTYAKKQFTEYNGLLCPQLNVWTTAITDAIRRETQKGRPVLVVNESIRVCHYLAVKLASILPKENLFIYDRSDVSKLVSSVTLKPGIVILTTNLGGRGTDLETTPEIEDVGGLHVLVTFLPSNQRVEDQAFGRTARQGRQGTAQLIVWQPKAQETVFPFNDQVETLAQLRAMRVLKETQRIKEIQVNTIPRGRGEDHLFQQVEDYMGTLLHQVPLQEHPEREKIQQVDQLWALQRHRLDYYKEDYYRREQKALRQQVQPWDLTFNAYAAHDAFDSFYTQVHEATEHRYAPSAVALKDRVIASLLNQKRVGAVTDVNAFCDTIFDTRYPPQCVLETLCQLTACTYVCIDQKGQMRIARNADDQAPVVCFGIIEGHAFVPDLSVLKVLYPTAVCAEPSRVEASQVPSRFYVLQPRGTGISDRLRAQIQKVPAVVSGQTLVGTPPHPQHATARAYLETKEQQTQKHFYENEERYQLQWVRHFIENVRTVYQQGDTILIVPAFLAQLAFRSEPGIADALFSRAAHVPHLHRALVYYNWANYGVCHNRAQSHQQLLEKLKWCEETLQEQIRLWQYIALFAGEHATDNPIGDQVRGRLGFYNRLLTTIHHNRQIVEVAANGNGTVVVNSQEPVSDLTALIQHFHKVDAEQMHHLGLDTLSVYGVKPPEPSYADIVLVNVLGVFQTVIGGVLTATGVPMASALLMSGLNDIWRGAKAALTGVFSWENYWFDKCIDVLTVAVSHMYGVIKDNVLKVRSMATAVVARKQSWIQLWRRLKQP